MRYFTAILVLFKTWNDLFCGCVDAATRALHCKLFIFAFAIAKSLVLSNLIPDRRVRTYFASRATRNIRKMTAETRSHIFRLCSHLLGVFKLGVISLYFFTAKPLYTWVGWLLKVTLTERASCKHESWSVFSRISIYPFLKVFFSLRFILSLETISTAEITMICLQALVLGESYAAYVAWGQKYNYKFKIPRHI